MSVDIVSICKEHNTPMQLDKGRLSRLGDIAVLLKLLEWHVRDVESCPNVRVSLKSQKCWTSEQRVDEAIN